MITVLNRNAIRQKRLFLKYFQELIPIICTKDSSQAQKANIQSGDA